MKDLFICHASEDKDFVRELVYELSDIGLKVWFDEFEINVGDSLRKKIEDGLKESSAGVVILSPSFLKGKQWTEHELTALDALEKGNKSKILPVWHEITYEELLDYSPVLADRFATNSKQGANSVASALKRAVNPIRGTKLCLPSWENEYHRFIEGKSEMNIDGKTCTIYECAVYLKEEDYPLIYETQAIERKDLMDHLALKFYEYPDTEYIPQVYWNSLSVEARDKLWEIMGKIYPDLKRPNDL